MFKKIICVSIAFVVCTVVFAQNKTIDSLKLVLKGSKHDTTRVMVLIELSSQLSFSNIDTVTPLCLQALNIIDKDLPNANPKEKRAYLILKSVAFNNIGSVLYYKGEINKSFDYQEKSLQIRRDIGDKRGLAESYANIGSSYSFIGDTVKALDYNLKGVNIAEEIGDEKIAANGLNNIGDIFASKDRVLALTYYTRALKLREKINDKPGLGISYNNLGVTYENLGDIKNALVYYGKGLKLQEEINDKRGIAFTLGNLAGAYKDQGEYITALEYNKKSLKINEEIGDRRGIAIGFANIGVIYQDLKDYNKALDYFTKSLKISEEFDIKEEIMGALDNLGDLFLKQKELSKALLHLNKGLKISRELGSKPDMARFMNNLGYVYYEQKNYKTALLYSDSSLSLSRESGFPKKIKAAENLLSKIYYATGNYKAAFDHYKEFILYRDSIVNNENRKAGLKNQFKYEYEKKAIVDSVRVNEEKKVISAKLNEERTKNYALYGGLFLVLLFSGFMVNRFRVTSKQKKIIEIKEQETQKQNEIITYQKHLVEEKHKEIKDSINYAERIQRSFLATTELLNANLKDYFVYFKPKDVVSGDFYWAHQLNNGNFILVTADSTGHGVPGAIMSILNISSLEKAVEQGLESPAEILNNTRNTIINRLKKDGSPEGGKDGMDCSLININLKQHQLTYAAANNPVWIVREKQLIELHPDKMPVGKHDRDHIPFAQNSFELQKNDIVYTLTDGLPDQFGGQKGKKFMYKKLKELLISISSEPMPIQEGIINDAFVNWKGELEQVDDVTLIGIRI